MTDPAVVFVLTRHYDREGERPHGVYAALEIAQAHGTAWLQAREYDATWSEQGAGVWVAGENPTMVVRREPVRTERPTRTRIGR